VLFEVVILRGVSELTRVEYDVLLSFASLEKQKRLTRFCFFDDAKRSLVGDILVRVELCRITGLSNRELEFAVNSFGKPFLVNNSHVHYNISHVGDYVVCVISDVPVGIDIELIKPIDVNVVERFFMSDEKAYVLSSSGDDVRNERFFEVWTKKESRIKLEGTNVFKFLSSFSVLDSLKHQNIFYHCIYNADKIIGYVCSSNKGLPLVRVIDAPALLQSVSLFQ
jgi:4'-phosphopantetheinyl transferase